jgi:hypothetical protein
VSYRDAVVLLGGDPPALAALDRVLAGALSLGTGGVSDVALSVFDAQPRIVLLGRDLDFLDAVLAAAPPQPTPDLPPERFAAVLAQ